jgi:hypothetical protein
MHKKLTITVDEDVYKGLYDVIGRGHISQFLSDIARPFVVKSSLDNAYASMAKDVVRENEAREWANNLSGDLNV